MGNSTREIERESGMAIKPHTASHAEHINRVVTVDDFDNGGAIKVHEDEQGELTIEREMVPGVPVVKEFITGPRVDQ